MEIWSWQIHCTLTLKTSSKSHWWIQDSSWAKVSSTWVLTLHKQSVQRVLWGNWRVFPDEPCWVSSCPGSTETSARRPLSSHEHCSQGKQQHNQAPSRLWCLCKVYAKWYFACWSYCTSTTSRCTTLIPLSPCCSDRGCEQNVSSSLIGTRR